MPKSKVLVTGGRGFIGSNLVRELEKRGHQVWSCGFMHSELENYVRCGVSKYRQARAGRRAMMRAKLYNANTVYDDSNIYDETIRMQLKGA